jgi:hypothetical protein
VQSLDWRILTCFFLAKRGVRQNILEISAIAILTVKFAHLFFRETRQHFQLPADSLAIYDDKTAFPIVVSNALSYPPQKNLLRPAYPEVRSALVLSMTRGQS